MFALFRLSPSLPAHMAYTIEQHLLVHLSPGNKGNIQAEAGAHNFNAPPLGARAEQNLCMGPLWQYLRAGG
jgi:hypothetical protein